MSALAPRLRRHALAPRLRRRAFLAAPLALATRGWAQSRQDPAERPGPRVFDLVLEHRTVDITGTPYPAMAINGQIPGPALRFREGEDIVITVTNRLREHSSLHWHGLLVPSSQDGVPGISDGFTGIMPGETHQYRFPLKQAGTYWYHSHSGTQEQAGLYGPIIIEPQRPDPFGYERDYIVELSDWIDENPHRVIANLKRDPGYYNYAKRTGASLVRAMAQPGADPAALVKDRLMWGDMRMDPTDIEDVTGYTFLVNGRSPSANYTARFQPGERIRLRFINSSAMTHQDIRIPGLRMTVVQADGNNVEPVLVDEFRIAPAETLDVIVEPKGAEQFQILGESMGRQGFARMTLATSDGLPPLPLPPHRPRPVLTMADMMAPPPTKGADRGTPRPETDQVGHVAPMDMPGMDHTKMDHAAMPGMDHAAMMGHAMPMADAFTPDTGAPAGSKVLSYRDLKALDNPWGDRAPDRTIEVRLTGNMERYFWSINGNKYSEAQPIVFHYGERVRLRFVNDTMMNHPMHLHGLWMVPDVGNGARNPLKHTLNIKPGSTMQADVVADAEGGWAFHCHLLYHMETGMMRKVVVERASAAR